MQLIRLIRHVDEQRITIHMDDLGKVINFLSEALINYLCGMKRKAHGAQEPKHI